MEATESKSSVTTSDQVIIRKTQPGDAEGLLELFRGISAEPNVNVAYTFEETSAGTIEKEQQRIINSSENSCYLVAEKDGKIIGNLLLARDHWTTSTHVAFLGIDVRKDFRNQGIGTKMMKQAVDWANEAGVKRIELEVFARNAPAIHLYEKFSFEVEGVRRRSVYKWGEYLDTWIMGLLL